MVYQGKTIFHDMYNFVNTREVATLFKIEYSPHRALRLIDVQGGTSLYIPLRYRTPSSMPFADATAYRFESQNGTTF